MLVTGFTEDSSGQSAPSGGEAPVLLWAGGAPGAKGTGPEDKPTLTAFLPASNPTHTAVVVAPGGGYVHLAMDYEGYDVARWLNAHGVAAFVLQYRLGPKYRDPIELEDAQRAVRMVRAAAARNGIATDHIGMWGFSAGGHLAATAGTQFDAGRGDATDAIDRVSSRPDFLVLAYPVITMRRELTHMGSHDALLGADATAAEETRMSAETRVTARTPPTFLFATTDDDVVPVMNSVLFYEAMVRAKVPAEMHLFQHGRHGVGLGEKEAELRVWPELLLKWMVERGYAAVGTGVEAARR